MLLEQLRARQSVGIAAKEHRLGQVSGWEQGTALETEAAEQLGELRKLSFFRKPNSEVLEKPNVHFLEALCS